MYTTGQPQNRMASVQFEKGPEDKFNKDEFIAK